MNYLLTYLFGFRQKFGFGFHTLCEFYTFVRLFLIASYPEVFERTKFLYWNWW